MIAVSRERATPPTIALFLVMAATGVLMFFHAESGLQKTAHEWLGWALLGGVALHVAANWLAFRRHLKQPGLTRGVLVAGALALAASFFITLPGGGGAGGPPPVLAMRAVAQAPLARVALLTDQPVAQLRQKLAAAGIDVPRDEQSIASVVGADREQMGRAMNALFAAR